MHNLEPTVVQQNILAFVKSFLSAHGYPPTRLEICRQFGFKNVNSASYHLTALAKLGAIRITPRTPRGIKCLL